MTPIVVTLVSTGGGETPRGRASHASWILGVIKERRGAAAIELALMSPFLILLLLGIIDYGNLTYTMMEVSTAAHAGAFYAFQNGATCSTSGITNAETAATSLGAAISTSPPAGSTGLTQYAPTCTLSGCVNAGAITKANGTTCASGDPTPGTYAVAYAQMTFTPLVPFAQFAFPSTLSATAALRYQ